MAKCDEGYRCQVCGADVTSIEQSSLYLRFVIGQVRPELLHTIPERHIRCDPDLAQFIVDDAFPPIQVEGDFDKRLADPASIRPHEQLVTRGWQRLVSLAENRPANIMEYPLQEVRTKLQRNSNSAQ